MLPLIIHSLVANVALLSFALAIPVIPHLSRTIEKRAVAPQIALGFTAQETQQLEDGFRNAMQLASYVRDPSSSDVVDGIFLKYFPASERATVNAVFDKIIDGAYDNPPGNPLLGDITVVVDYPTAKGVYACDGTTMAELRDWSTSNPKMIVCAGAGFGHGGIGLGYTDVAEVNCDYVNMNDGRTSWRMDTLGSVILHEYTHFLALVVPPLAKETDDDGYGPWETRGNGGNFDLSMATNNADSYSWFANEVLWTVLCQKDYGDPIETDEDDPACDDTVCQAPKGP